MAVTSVMGRGTMASGSTSTRKREAHENGELGASIKAADVLGGVGFGVALGLRGGKDGGVFGALLHAAEDEVAGAVEDALNALDAVAGHALLQAGNNGNAAGDGRAVLEVTAAGRGQTLQLHAVIRDEFLVGGDDAFAGFKSLAHPRADRIETADQFDYDVDVRGKNRVRIFGPHPRQGRSSLHACGRRCD